MSTTKRQELVFQGACALLGPKLFLNVCRDLKPVNTEIDDAIGLSSTILKRVISQIDIPPAVTPEDTRTVS